MVIRGGAEITVHGSVGAQVFDALVAAGLVKQLPLKDDYPWATWGITHGDDLVTFTLVEEKG